MGKTAVSIQYAVGATNAGFYVDMYNLEMFASKLADRIIKGMVAVNPYRYDSGRLSDSDIMSYSEAMRKLRQNDKLSIDDNPTTTVSYIRSKSRLKKAQGKLDMIVIDYLQLLKCETKMQSRELEVSSITRDLKLLAKELEIPIILLCQLNRSVETRGGEKKPMLSDLRESGAIEQDADSVSFIYRPSYYGFHEDAEGQKCDDIIEIIVAKYREGNTGTIPLRHNKSITRIFDYEESGPDRLPTIAERNQQECLNPNAGIQVNMSFENQGIKDEIPPF
jgi:replicative DNA helicase